MTYRIPLQASTTDHAPDGITKWFASRYTGTPDKRSAATVKSAVQSMSVGTRNSPAGTANSRNASANPNTREAAKPMTVTIDDCSMNTSANCDTTPAPDADATNQSAPLANTTARPGHHGLIGAVANSSWRRHASQSASGRTTKPCANVSDRIQIATMDAAVGQYT